MASYSLPFSKRFSATKGVVVWEWFNEFGKWRPYNPEIVMYIEKEGQMTSQVYLGTISASLKMYTIDIPSLCQIRKGTGTARPVRRVIYPSSSPPAQQVVWEFEGDTAGHWVPYDMEIAVCLEQAQQSGQSMLDMNTLFQLPYSIHFTTMQQVRISTGRARQIRRSPLPVPYPSAGKSPKCFSKLTTIITETSLLSNQGTGHHPSTTGVLKSSGSFSLTSAAVATIGSTSQSSIRRTKHSSSSDTDSDSDMDTLNGVKRVRTRLYKKMKLSHNHSQGSSSTRKDSISAISLPGTAAAVTYPTAMPAPRSSIHPTPLMLNCNPLSGPSYVLPTVSLVNSGPSMSLSLVTYAQPLGAHLTHGFPPMTHIPPPQQPRQTHHTPNHSSQILTVTPHQPGLSSHSLSAQPGPAHSQCQTQCLVSSSQPQSHAHLNHSTAVSLQNSSKWISMPNCVPSSSSSMSLSSTSLGSTSQCAPGPGAAYQGPLTRTRFLKQQITGCCSGSGSNGDGGTMGSSVNSGMTLTSVKGIQPLMSHLQQNFNSSLSVASKNAVSQVSTLQSPSQSHLGQHLQHLHHLQQQHQHLQQKPQHLQVHGMVSGSGYPYSMSSFIPSMSLSILPQPALLLPASTHGQVSHNAAGKSGAQQPASSMSITEMLPIENKIVLPRQKKSKHKPKTAEEVLNKYMEAISPQENEDCCICCDSLTGPSGFGEGKLGQFDVIRLNKCSHMFHRLCLLAMYGSSHQGDSLQCPTCKTIYGELMGNCPPGEMNYDILSRPLPGHPHCGTIRVTYYISPGVQGPEHPHPGQRFTARGFPRSGFLPDDNTGRKILKMLMLAFKRKLMFTIGHSATTGESDTVTWNEIHHKTEFGSNVSGHGYPDPNYLDNVTAELALKGITEEDL